MTPLPQRWTPSVAADGRSRGTSTRMPTTAGSTRRIWEGSGDTWRGSRRRSASRGAAAAGRIRPSRATAAQAIDGRGQRLLEARGGRPAERADLAGVEGVAAIVPGPVGHRRDEALRLAEQAQDPAGQGHVLHFRGAAVIVDLAGHALAEDEVDR